MTETAIATRPSLLYRTQGVIFLIAAIVAFWILFQGILPVILLLAIGILFIIGLKNPLWAMAALMVSQLTITSFLVSTPLFDISLRLLLLILTFFLVGRSLIRKEIDLGPDAHKIIIPMIIFIIINFVSNMVNSVDFEFVFKDFRNLLVGLLFIIVIPAIINNSRQLKTICIVTLVMIISSALIGLLQHYNFFGTGQATVVPGFITTMGRVPGMGETELELSYLLPATILILLGIFFARGFRPTDQKYIVLSMLVMLAATYFTYTRSALVAVGIGVLSLIFFFWKRINWRIIVALVFILILIISATDFLGQVYLSGRTESGQESSSIARDILWQATIAIALDNPILGIGTGSFIQLSPSYASSVDPALIQYEEDRYWQYRTLGSTSPHNDFLKTWAFYGTLALLVYLWMHFVIVQNCSNAFKNSRLKLVKGLSVGIAAAIVTVIVNSFYHNVVDTLPILWIFAGFSLSLTKVASKEVRV